MAETVKSAVTVVGIDIGKNSFHAVGPDRRGAIALRQRWSRGQVEVRLANMAPCLIGMEACLGGALSGAAHSAAPHTDLCFSRFVARSRIGVACARRPAVHLRNS